MLIHTPAIFLNHLFIGDNGHIVHLYTQTHGPMSVIVKGSKRSSIRSVFMQPLSLIDVVINQKSKQTLHHIKESKPLVIYHSIPFDPIKGAITMFLAEWLSHSIKEQHPDEPLFEFIKESFLTFDSMIGSSANFHLVFLIKLTRFLGIFPNLSHFDEGVYFDLQNSEFTNLIPLHSHYLNPEDSLSCAHLMRLNYDTMHRFLLNREQRQHILSEIERSYKMHIPGFGNLKELAVVAQLCDGFEEQSNRKSTRLNSSHIHTQRMSSSALNKKDTP